MLIRSLILFFSFICFGAAKADESTSSTTNLYQNLEHKYRIEFPTGWALATPNKTFTHVKARAPKGYAAVSVACRDSLWRGDEASTRFKDAWEALDGISVTTFTNNFEHNSSTESAAIVSLGKAMLAKERAIKVDYILTDSAQKVSVRIRSFFILHSKRWYSVNCATLKSQPDVFLDLMLKAAGTFEFVDAKPNG